MNMISDQIFFNRCFDKNRLKGLISWSLMNYGENATIELVEKLKDLGFEYATRAGISLGIDDLKIPPTKSKLISEAENHILSSQNDYQKGNLTAVERFQQMIDTWHRTSEILRQNVIYHFKTTDILNPVYMMAFSGARGNISQVRQLVGMRGLMADPQGQIIDFPIRSNFREGLTVTEYIISCYGARKGLVDTALRTANSGYLTRRLVDVSQHVIVCQLDCGTNRGMVVTNLQEGNKTILSLQNRLLGRILAEDIEYSEISESSKNVSIFYSSDLPHLILLKKNQQITTKIASKIAKIKKRVLVRSPLTCEAKNSICQLCYGCSLAHGNLVSLGEAVGILAAQSIGEPGTQLTMRTFHTGGVFSGDLMDEIRAPYTGKILFSEFLYGMMIRTSHGKIAFLTKNQGNFYIEEISSNGSDHLFETRKKTIYNIPAYTVLFVRNGQTVTKQQIVAEYSSVTTQRNQRIQAKHDLNSELEGQIYFENVILTVKKNLEGNSTKVAKQLGSLWILSGKIYQSLIPSKLFIQKGDIIDNSTTINESLLLLPYTGNLENFSGSDDSYQPNRLESSNSLFSIKSRQKFYFKKSAFLLDLKNIKYKKFGYFFSIFKKQKDIYETYFLPSTISTKNIDLSKNEDKITIYYYCNRYKIPCGGIRFFDNIALNEKNEYGQVYWVRQNTYHYQKNNVICFQSLENISHQYFTYQINLQGAITPFCNFTNTLFEIKQLEKEVRDLNWKNQNDIFAFQSNAVIRTHHKKRKSIHYFRNPMINSLNQIDTFSVNCFFSLSFTNDYFVGEKISRSNKFTKYKTNRYQSILCQRYRNNQKIELYRNAIKKISLPTRIIKNFNNSKQVECKQKQGWIYFPKDSNKIDKFHNKFYYPGQKLVDKLIFDQTVTYIEILPITHFFQIYIYSRKNILFSLKLKNKIFYKRYYHTQSNVQLYTIFKKKSALICIFNTKMREFSFKKLNTLTLARNLPNHSNDIYLVKKIQKHNKSLFFGISNKVLKDIQSRKKNKINFIVLIRKVFELPTLNSKQLKNKLSQNNAVFSDDISLNSRFFNKQKVTRLLSPFPSIDFKIQTNIRHFRLQQNIYSKSFNVFETSISVLLPGNFPLQKQNIQFIEKQKNFQKILFPYKSPQSLEEKIPFLLKKENSTKTNTKTSNINIISRILDFSFLRKLEVSNLINQQIQNQTFHNNQTFTNTKLFEYKNKFILRNNPATLTSFFSPYKGEIHKIRKEISGKESCIFLTDVDIVTFLYNKKNTPNLEVFIHIGQFIRYGDEIITNGTIHQSGQIIEVNKQKILVRKGNSILFSSKGVFHVKHDDFIEKKSPLVTLFYQRLKTGDIVQGIPKIEELFEARQTKEGEALAENIHQKLHDIYYEYKQKFNPQEAARVSLSQIQQILVDNVQKVYQSQGVSIADKHIEIIVRQMTSKVRIVEGGQTGLLRGELIDLEWIEIVNRGIETQKAEYEPIVLGITKASLETESFISAASFQETTRILTRAAIENKTDFLRGLKENVILGHLIPAGTGFSLTYNPTLSPSKKDPTLQIFS